MQVVAEKSRPRMRMAAKVTELRPAAKEHHNPARRGPAERFSRSRRPQGFASIAGAL
jgi:hypothetical protein